MPDIVWAPSAEQVTKAAGFVEYYIKHRHVFDTFEQSLSAVIKSEQFAELIHSARSRLKDPVHLNAKILRKMRDGQTEDWSNENLFLKITDLVGYRVLHLHTSQIAEFVPALKAKLLDSYFEILEEPTARLWDDEYRKIFEQYGIDTTKSDSMYTSVHLTVKMNSRRYEAAGEIQIRTLAEELWGEVDHTINYPEKIEDLTCRDQLKALARITSACTRSVDCIFNHLKNIGASSGVSMEPPSQ